MANFASGDHEYRISSGQVKQFDEGFMPWRADNPPEKKVRFFNRGFFVWRAVVAPQISAMTLGDETAESDY